jgi:glycosyltransferase involved in cell wall biosynthesis
VAINLQFHPNRGGGGFEAYATGLIHALGKLDDGSEEYVIVGPWLNSDWMKPRLAPNQHIVRGPFAPAFAKKLHSCLCMLPGTAGMWQKVPKSGGFFESLDCDVVHFPYQEFVACDLPTIYNPHDLQHLYYPQFFKPSDLAWREVMYRAGCRHAHTVMASSSFVKKDIVQHYQEDSAKIQIIPGAPLIQARTEPSSEALAAVSNKYSLDKPFALYPSMTWPHKNHIRLLQAMALLRDRDRLRVQLVCTGHKNSFWRQIRKQINSLGLQDQVSFLGMLPSEELGTLYRLAQFVIIPTLFEATSGPLLEAWQYGIPAACSSVTALPDQAMGAALLFDPHCVEAIADALAQMAMNPGLREDYRQRGARRLQDFSWERTARAYRAVYRRAGGFPLSEEDRRLLSWDWMREPQRQSEVSF